jgi:hypothetical protein
VDAASINHLPRTVIPINFCIINLLFNLWTSPRFLFRLGQQPGRRGSLSGTDYYHNTSRITSSYNKRKIRAARVLNKLHIESLSVRLVQTAIFINEILYFQTKGYWISVFFNTNRDVPPGCGQDKLKKITCWLSFRSLISIYLLKSHHVCEGLF